MYANSDTRKGLHLLQPALQQLSHSHWQNKIELGIFGATQPENPEHIGFKTHYLGYLNDDISLGMAYSAADVMVFPALQEAFGQTASEALACATPVVAFNSTGLKDIVDHQRTGYLAQPYDVVDLAAGIALVLDNSERHTALCKRSRQKVEQEFTLQLQAQRYATLFEELLAI